MQTTTHTLDATGKKLGRLGSEAARLLMGKNSTAFVRNAAPDVEVVITNASKLDIPLRKLSQEMKSRFSGFPSGIKTPTVGLTIAKKGKSELLRIAIRGMLPHNKLRAEMLRNLTISE